MFLFFLFYFCFGLFTLGLKSPQLLVNCILCAYSSYNTSDIRMICLLQNKSANHLHLTIAPTVATASGIVSSISDRGTRLFVAVMLRNPLAMVIVHTYVFICVQLFSAHLLL